MCVPECEKKSMKKDGKQDRKLTIVLSVEMGLDT